MKIKELGSPYAIVRPDSRKEFDVAINETLSVWVVFEGCEAYKPQAMREIMELLRLSTGFTLVVVSDRKPWAQDVARDFQMAPGESLILGEGFFRKRLKDEITRYERLAAIAELRVSKELTQKIVELIRSEPEGAQFIAESTKSWQGLELIASREEYDAVVRDNPSTIMVFALSTCPFCKAFAGEAREMASKLGNKATLRGVVVDSVFNKHWLKPLWEDLGINEYPTVVYYENGKETQRGSGVLAYATLAARIAKMNPVAALSAAGSIITRGITRG